MSDSCAEAAGAIKAIDKHSVHQICSGQVVLTLATAVKELVENSIDAGATSVDVRLKESGAELVEVSDNGRGVEEANFEGLTLKHHTSKLRDFSDLVHVETFGFRGEALSSLCALSNLSVVTCHESSQVGTKLLFDHKGLLVQRSPHPRQQGTTVSLQQLFCTLPVRHKEFQRNIKKEFSRMVHVLQAYCLVSSGVRISCSNQSGPARRSTVLSTGGSHSMRDNVGAVFGTKQLQSLLPFHQVSPSQSVLEEFGLRDSDLPKQLFTISGFVSRGEHGAGRSATDRQFFFINNRPCDPLKVTKLVNEVYHMYNRHQYPFVSLNIVVASECVDVNVTPDKRQVFLQEEKLLLAVLKSSLVEMFEAGVNKISVNHTLSSRASERHPVVPSNGSSRESSGSPPTVTRTSMNLAGLKAAFSKHHGSRSAAEKDSSCGTSQKSLQAFFFKDPGRVSSSGKSKIKSEREEEAGGSMLEGFGSRSSSCREEEAGGSMLEGFGSRSSSCREEEAGGSMLEGFSSRSSSCRDSEPQNVTTEFTSGTPDAPGCESPEAEINTSGRKHQGLSEPADGHSEEEEQEEEEEEEEAPTDEGSAGPEAKRVRAEDPGLPPEHRSSCWSTRPDRALDAPVPRRRRTVPLLFSLQTLAVKVKRLNDRKWKNDDDAALTFRRFRAKINPGENQSAEEELKKEISKDMFKEMEIIGQFNLGFIITKLNSDIFMIDQHASDEKYNFEMLQQNTVIQGQKLIAPQSLGLTAVSENVLMENMEIFRKNGFEFLVDEDAPVMDRVKLLSLPTSKNWTFGPADIEELIFMLSDSPGVMCRPSRVRQMFASRACRKSVMIGTALSVGEMKKLVLHMGDMEQPWNCPHGRPTMRHLVNLDVLSD